MIILIICLDKQANNTLPVIIEVHHCSFYYIMNMMPSLKKDYYSQLFRTETLTFLLSQTKFLLFIRSMLHSLNIIAENRAKE